MSYILVELKGKKFIRHFSVRIKSFLATNSRYNDLNLDKL